MKKWAFITGASGEIGAAIAMQVAAQNYNILLHYNSNPPVIDEIIDQTKDLYGVAVDVIQADLSKDTDIKKIISSLSSYEVEVFIHCAGNSYVGLLTDMSDIEISSMVQLHLTSPMQLTKALLPSMIKNKNGKIIILSSVWGLTGASCEVVYSAVKGGLNTFVKALAKEVAPSNIYVNGVAPGAIKTKMLNSYTSEELQLLSEEIPFGRLGSPSEVANVVSFLISSKSSYISGQIISINGAWYC